MAQNSNNSTLEYTHISSHTDEIITYINNRRSGINYGLKTRWRKLNNTICGGIEPHMLVTIAGISGSGKSSLSNALETDFFDMNPTVDFVVLSFQLEMLGSRNVGRKLSAKLDKTTTELYSGRDDTNLTEDDYQRILEGSCDIKKYPIYYVDTTGTVEEIRNTILKFLNEPFVKGKWVVIFLDHVLLTRGKQGESERQSIADLQYMFVELKKKHKISVIQISQLNRNIEEKERILNPSMQFPMRSDVFGADSIYQCSDILIVIHRPFTLGIHEYGLEKWLTKGLVYLHILKQRDGEPKILCFEDHLKYNKLLEYDPYNKIIT
jgi:replicative DNA helicase